MSQLTENSLFTVNQAAKACGLSRAMILKLEKEGYMSPTRIDKHSGYRYFSHDDIVKLQHYRLLRDIGLSKREVSEFFSPKTTPSDILPMLERRIAVLKRCSAEIECSADKSERDSVVLVDVPKQIVYTQTDTTDSYEAALAFSVSVFREAIFKGFECAFDSTTFIILRDDAAAGKTSINAQHETETYVSLPVKYEGYPDTKTIPSFRALRMIVPENPADIDKARDTLLKEFKARKLKSDGTLRISRELMPLTEVDSDAEKLVHVIMQIKE